MERRGVYHCEITTSGRAGRIVGRSERRPVDDDQPVAGRLHDQAGHDGEHGGELLRDRELQPESHDVDQPERADHEQLLRGFDGVRQQPGSAWAWRPRDEPVRDVRPASPIPLAEQWNAPANGNWTVDTNWLDGSAPVPVDPTTMLIFGGRVALLSEQRQRAQLPVEQADADQHAATTNVLGAWRWSSGTLGGSGTVGTGAFTITNPVNLMTNLEFRARTWVGDAEQQVTGVGTLTKYGPGPCGCGVEQLCWPGDVNSTNGTLRLENAGALSTNSITVNTGTLLVTNVRRSVGTVNALTAQ